MRDFYLYVAAAVLLVVLLLFLVKKLRARRYPYAARPLLTKREYRFYMLLRRETDARGLLILPKVGVKDLLQVTTEKQYMKYFRQIAQKHVDFVICDQSLRILFALELDDNSHDTESARERDHFKDMAFRAAKVPLKRIREYDELSIQELFK